MLLSSVRANKKSARRSRLDPLPPHTPGRLAQDASVSGRLGACPATPPLSSQSARAPVPVLWSGARSHAALPPPLIGVRQTPEQPPGARRAPSSPLAGLPSTRSAYGDPFFPSSLSGIRDAHRRRAATHLGSRAAMPPPQTSADK